MGDSPIIFIMIAVCFIIMISISIYNFVRIGNLKNESAELEISLKNESQSNIEKNEAKVLSSIDKVKSELKADMLSTIKNVKEEQVDADTSQDALITKNKADILLVQSNIDNVIKPKLVDFDGNFKSLEGAIESNKSGIEAVGTSITQLNTQLSTQFNTQYDQLSEEIKKINDSQFEDKIGKLQAAQTKIQSELVGINVNKQSIANNKAALETVNKTVKEITDEVDDVSGDFMSLADKTLELANVVDDHDLIVKSL